MQKQLFWLSIILANIGLACFAICDPLHAINSDGVLYLQTAEAYLQGGWHAAMQLYSWPFYSILIAWVSQICHCSLELAAYLIDVIFQILICLGFFNVACWIATAAKLPCNDGESETTSREAVIASTRPALVAGVRGNPENNELLFQTFVTLIILLYPAFNHHRDLIIRDFGYWAFSLWGWFYLIRLNEECRSLDGIRFSVSMLLASLFRLEGIVMLLFAPFAIFARRKIALLEKLSIFLKAYSTTLIFLVGSLGYFWLYADKPDNFGRLLDMKAQVYSGIDLMMQGLLQARQHIASYVLTPVSADSAVPLLIGGLVAVYAKMLILTLTPVYSILVGISIWKKQFSPTSSARVVIGTGIFLNLLITIIFLMQSLFLTERYLFGLSFLLLLWAPFALLWIYKKTKAQKPWVFWGVLAIMGLVAVISLHNVGPSKAYLKQAGAWVHENLPKQEWIYTNSPQIGFYMQRPLVIWESNSASAANINNIMKEARQKKYAYLVFQVKANDVLLKQQLNQRLAKPVKIFVNDRGDAVWVYWCSHT